MAGTQPVGVIGQIGIDVNDMGRAIKFWTELLGLEVGGQEDAYTHFKKQNDGPRLYLQKVPEKKTAKTRLHLDIAVEDMDAAVARGVELGAKKIQAFDHGDFGWTVMEDPDGNEFCFTFGE